MHKAICTKVQGQTHMRYVLKHIRSNFLNFSLFEFFTFYVVLDFLLTQSRNIKVRPRTKQCIQINARCTKCMMIWHLMHDDMTFNAWRVLQRSKELDQRQKKNTSSTIRTLPHPNGMIVWNECLMGCETRVGRMKTGNAHRQGGKCIKHFL